MALKSGMTTGEMANPYRVAYTVEEVEKFDISTDAIIAGFRGVPHWPPLTLEQEAAFEYRVALTLYSGLIKLELGNTPSITDPELLAKYVNQGMDRELIQKAISLARNEVDG